MNPFRTAIALTVLGACSASPIDVLTLNRTSLQEGLVAYWPMDDGEQYGGVDGGVDGGTDPSMDAGMSTSIVSDKSAKGHPGTLLGGTWITGPDGGMFGGALHLEAPSDEVRVVNFPPPDQPPKTPDWSVSLWVRLPATPEIFNNDPFLTLLSTEVPKGVGSAQSAGGWEMNLGQRMTSKAFFQFAYWVGPGISSYITYDTTTNATPGKWTHLVAVLDTSAETLSFYVDGVLEPNPTAVGTKFIIPTPETTTLFMGRWQGGGRHFTGDLDDVAVYNRVLNALEVQTLYQRPVIPLPLP